MKRAISIVCSIIMIMMLGLTHVESFYASGSLKVSGVPNSVNIGDEFKVNITCPKGVSARIQVKYDAGIFQFVSGDNASGGNGLLYVTGGSWGEDKEVTNTVVFKALKSTSSPSVISVVTDDATDVEGNPITLGGASASISVVNKDEVKSSDNSLSYLKLSKGTLSPSFKPNVTKYTATVNYDVSSIVIDARTSNGKAEIISDVGSQIKLSVGENVLKIVVEAEDGKQATYTIVVTRKAQETTAADPSESETTSESEATTPEVNEMLQWNGEQLMVPDNIPTEGIPTSFESTLLVVNGQQMQGLSFTKGDLKVLYLNNTNGAGSLYVYDEAQQTIYPFIKLTSEKSYVMVLLPDEQNAPAPAGFESCTFSIEGKGLISAYQLKEETSAGTEELEDSTGAWNIFGAETFYAAEPKASDFYLIYCMNDEGEKGWYMYDSVEETFQRYMVTASSVQTGADVEDTDLESKYAALEKELNAAKMTQYIIIAVAALVVVILIIVIVVLGRKNRNKDEDFFEGYEDEEVYEDYEEEDDVEHEIAEESDDEIYVDISDEVVEDEAEDDEIEIEFYEMEETPVEEDIVDTDEEVYVDTMVETVEDNDNEIEIEFYNMEEAILNETKETEEKISETQAPKPESVVEQVVEPEIRIERRPRVTDPTSILSGKKEDDDDLEFIDFE